MRRYLFVLALLATPAAAQEAAIQTPEGAQRFLATLIDQYDVFAVTTYSVPNVHLVYRLTGAGAGADGACRMTLTPDVRAYFRNPGTAGQLEVREDRPGWDEAEYRRMLEIAGVPEPPFVIDWSRITGSRIVTTSAPEKAKSDDRARRVAIEQNARVPFVLIVPDEGLAKRLDYAIKFLKEHCDKTADTGF